MWAWQQAKLSGADKDVLKSFAQCAKAVRVRFEYLPDEHECERRKFLLRQESKDAEQTEVLNGWNLICAVNDVRVLMRRSGLLGKGADEAALETWWLCCPSKHFSLNMFVFMYVQSWEWKPAGLASAWPASWVSPCFRSPSSNSLSLLLACLPAVECVCLLLGSCLGHALFLPGSSAMFLFLRRLQQPRFGKQLKGYKARALKTMLKVYDRVMAADERCRGVIAELEAISPQHLLSTYSALDIICSKTACKSAKVQNELMVWCFEHVQQDVQAKRLPIDATNAQLALAVQRYLLIKRVVNHFAKQFKGVDDPDCTYAAGKAPSVVVKTVFCSMASFKESGLDKCAAGSSTWLSDLPPHFVPVMDFIAKMMRGHVQVNQILEGVVQSDPTISAEGFIHKCGSEKGGLAELFNVGDAMKAHTEACQACEKAMAGSADGVAGPGTETGAETVADPSEGVAGPDTGPRKDGAEADTDMSEEDVVEALQQDEEAGFKITWQAPSRSWQGLFGRKLFTGSSV